MRDVTIIIVTFDRPQALKGCLRSIRNRYRDIPIIVSDNGKDPLTKRHCRKFGARHLDLPYDCGANMARKQGQGAVDTKYWVIGEDDFIFTRDTQLENFKLVLDHDRKVDLIGGPCIRNNNIGTIGSTFRIEEEYKTFYRTPIRNPVYNVVKGVSYFYCDFVRMFFMTRKDTPIDWEEKQYIGSGTHISVLLKNFLNKGNSGHYQLAFTYAAAVSHIQIAETPEYRTQRKRVRSQWAKLFKETGLRYGVFDNKRVRDFKLNKNISYEEYLEIRVKQEGKS
jgi:glycosyltransferase involved in cell wall biosynthesis